MPASSARSLFVLELVIDHLLLSANFDLLLQLRLTGLRRTCKGLKEALDFIFQTNVSPFETDPFVVLTEGLADLVLDRDDASNEEDSCDKICAHVVLSHSHEQRCPFRRTRFGQLGGRDIWWASPASFWFDRVCHWGGGGTPVKLLSYPRTVYAVQSRPFWPAVREGKYERERCWWIGRVATYLAHEGLSGRGVRKLRVPAVFIGSIADAVLDKMEKNRLGIDKRERIKFGEWRSLLTTWIDETYETAKRRFLRVDPTIRLPSLSKVRRFARTSAEYSWDPRDSLYPNAKQETRFGREPEWEEMSFCDPTSCPRLGELPALWDKMDRMFLAQDYEVQGRSSLSQEQLDIWAKEDAKVAPPNWDGTICTGGDGIPIRVAPLLQAFAYYHDSNGR